MKNASEYVINQPIKIPTAYKEAKMTYANDTNVIRPSTKLRFNPMKEHVVKSIKETRVK